MDSSRSRRRIFPRLAGAALLVTALGLLAGCALPDNPFNHKIVSYPPPPTFQWTRVTPPPATPQEAYAQSMSSLGLCYGKPARAATNTWLVTGPDDGVVLVLADCSNISKDGRQGMAIFPISLDSDIQPRCPAWLMEGGMVTQQPPVSASLDDIGHGIPSWLPLPTDAYLESGLFGPLHAFTFATWQSNTRLFITGRFEGSATRPAGAETVSIGGHTGWQATDHDIVTVTLPLADGWTFFFSGTADSATMRHLASASLDHLDTLLPKPLPTPPSYPQPTPAC